MGNIYKSRNEFSFIQSFIFVTLAIFLFISFIPNNSYAYNKRWVSLTSSKGDSRDGEEGDPPGINIIYSDENYTEFEITMNGFYVEDIMGPDGLVYQTIEVPDYATTNDIGLPELPAIRGLLGIADNTSNVEMNVLDSTEMTLLGEYNIWPHQIPTFPGMNRPFVKNEEFYNSNNWFPSEHIEIGEPGIFKYYTVENIGYIPFRYNPYLRQLQINPYIRLRVDYTGGGAIPIATMDEDMANLMRDVIWNFDYLKPNIGPNVIIHYLIITPNEYEDAMNQFAYMVRNIYPNYYFYIALKSEVGNTPEQIKNYITDYYNNHNNTDYVLLVGNSSDLSPPDTKMPLYNKRSPAYDEYPYLPEWFTYGTDIPTDYWYTTLLSGNSPDLYPEVAVGRISCNNIQELYFQLYKIYNYYEVINNIQDKLYDNKVLLVAHRWNWHNDNPQYPDFWFKAMAENIANYPYYCIHPYFYKCYGEDGALNEHVKMAINAGVSSVLYLGHGGIFNWSGWSYNSEYWTENEINQLLNENKLTVVFNMGCLNGRIIYNSNSLCESWMLGGFNNWKYIAAVATNGFSHVRYGLNPPCEADYFSDFVYRGIYKSKGSAKGIGWLLNMATVNELKKYNLHVCSQHNAYANIILGDPALRLKVYSNEIYKNNSIIKSEKLISPISVFIENPVGDKLCIIVNSKDEENINVEMYDISGRKISNIFNGKINGEEKITYDINNISTGVYIIRISNDNNNICRKVVKE